MEQIKEGAATWLHFIRPDYYVAIELEKQGINPEQFGLTSESSCYNGRCEELFFSMTDSGYMGLRRHGGTHKVEGVERQR